MKGRLLVFLLFSTTQLSAQEDINEFLSMSLEELLQVEITSATLTPENLKTVPSAVTVFTHEEIKRLGFDKLGELMNLVPGFQSYQSSGSSLETPFSSRGRRIGGATAEILILVDGQRFDSPRTSGSSVLAPVYPLKYIEKVEFIRGPGAAVYGSNAMMGLINITTRSDVNQLSLNYGNFNRKQVFLQTSTQIGSMQMDVFGQIESDEGDTYNLQDTFSAARINTDDPVKIADINFKFHWENTQVNIQHNQFKVENFYELNTLSNGFNKRDGKITSISLKHNFNWQQVSSYFWLSHNATNATLNTQLTPANFFNNPQTLSNPVSDDPLLVSANFNNYTEIRTQLHNDWKIDNSKKLQFGIELRRINAPQSIASNNFDLGQLVSANFPVDYYGSLQPTTPIQTKSQRNILGIYTQYQQQLFTSTYLTLGLRYDDFSNIGSQTSPRFGLVHDINSNHSVKLLYGKAFRAPSESELNLINNPLILGNPNLKPETVTNWDLIWIGQWESTGFSFGLFESHFENSIVQTDIGGGIQQYNNMNQEPTKGFEFEISHELNKNWLVRADITHLIEKPNVAFRETKHKGSLMINYQYNKWNANLVSSYTDARQTIINNNQVNLDNYWLMFAKVKYNINAQFNTFIQAKNILDADYLTPSLGSDLTEGIANRGRELLIGISWKF